ncbi:MULTISPECIES: SHOCT domain-containing protein [unclassified Nocardioides]|uniref:SHOCT domain-containing protein n=1 Tax=unclassified Nocardioides TaxID=2615069 RepID=UPI0036175496
MGYWSDGHMDDGWGVAMMIGMMGFWIALIAGIVFLVVWTTQRTGGAAAAPPAPPAGGPQRPAEIAEQILAERLARGEIDAEEYRTRLDALTAARQA